MLPFTHRQTGIELPWTWCARCHRAYITGNARVVQFSSDALHPHPVRMVLCPYYDCNSSTRRHGWDWRSFQRQHPQYPYFPTTDVIYQD